MTKKKEVPLATAGDKEPTVPESMRGKGVTHLSLHKGVVLGRQPPFHMEPAEWLVCLLHMNLCILGGLFTRTIVNQVGKMTDPDVDSQSMALWQLLKDNGLDMKEPQLRQKNKRIDKYVCVILFHVYTFLYI